MDPQIIMAVVVTVGIVSLTALAIFKKPQNTTNLGMTSIIPIVLGLLTAIIGMYLLNKGAKNE